MSKKERKNSADPASLITSAPLPDQEDQVVPLSKKVKLLTAASIFYGNVTLGCAVNAYGPSLTSFQKKYDTDDATISTVFSIMVGGLLAGALSSGFLYKYVNRQLAVAGFFGCMGIIMFLTPHCPTLTTFFIAAAIMGAVSGFYGSAQFVWIMEMMQKDCPPYVQGQHFFYAFGTILSTLFMAPFLDNKNTNNQKSFNYSVENRTMTEDEEYSLLKESTQSSDKEDDNSSSKLFVPFTIIGCILLISMLFQIFLFAFFRYHPPPPEKKSENDSQSADKPDNSNVENPAWTWPKIRLVILSCMFFGATQAMENIVIQFLPKFGQNSDLKLSESESTYVLTGLTTSYAAARFICIFIVFKVPSQLLLCVNIVLTTLANILLIGWAKSSHPVLWTASILYGIGFSSMFASFSAFLERYLTITDFIGSLIMVSGSGMAAAYPQIVGSFIENNPVILGYTTFISIALIIFSFVVFSYITHKDKNKY